MTTRIPRNGDRVRYLSGSPEGKIGRVREDGTDVPELVNDAGLRFLWLFPGDEGDIWEFVDEIPAEELATAPGLNFEGKVDAVLADVKAGPVNPAHYKGFSRGSEVIDITENLNFNRGSAVKYLARAGVKDASTELEDLHKALWYVTREIARLTLPE